MSIMGSEQKPGNKASTRGPIVNIGYTIRVFGMDASMMMGIFPVIIFPFSSTAWIIGAINLSVILALTQTKIPPRQVIRWFKNSVVPRTLPPNKTQNVRNRFRPWPY